MALLPFWERRESPGIGIGSESAFIEQVERVAGVVLEFSSVVFFFRSDFGGSGSSKLDRFSSRRVGGGGFAALRYGLAG